MQFPEALEVFCDVARNRSFSQAGQIRGITQSAVSQIVSQLEKRVGGVQLFDRSTRPLQLTAAGQVYYEGARELLRRFAELEASVRSAQTQIVGIVQVAAIYSVGLGDMGHCVESFSAREPGARVCVEYLHPNEVYEKVLDGTVDLGLVSFPRRSAKLTAVPWREEVMLLVCAPKHRLAHNLAVDPTELKGEKYIHFTRDLTIRREVDRFLREYGSAVEVVLEFDNIENIKKAVEISEGVALLPEPTIRREVANHTLVGLPLSFDGKRPPFAKSAPSLGEDNAAILDRSR